ALTGIDDAYNAVDAVVHLAAIPAPGLTANAATFANNVPSTFHVFQAAKLAGIRKVVWASSETVLGLPFDDAPAYVPVDEAVAEPNSTYSLGKLVEETMAAQFCRWDPDLSMVGLRFSNVMLVRDYADFAGYTADQRRFNLWSYIDARDAAQAVELALAYEPHGVEIFVIASPDVVPHVPVEQLLADRFGEVEHTRPLGEYESPLSIDKARALLGFDPQHSWRDSD
ncbi:MAG: NAD-dependent epimerase/dehydratase family protein, partial [Janthinobacterium lividum]